MTGEQEPLVSVVIPTYNMEEHIAETLNSVMAQTLQSWEAIVVDDASTDRTAEIVRDLSVRDPRIRYVRLDSNSNLPAVPRNRGIREAKGSYIAFLDHDDLWIKEKLERQVCILEKNPDVALVHSHLWEFTRRSRFRGLIFVPDPVRRRASVEVFDERNVVQCSSAILRSAVLSEIGGFDERPEFRTVEDYELWRRVSHDNRIAYISEVHGSYRHSAFGTSGQVDSLARHNHLDSVLGTRLLDNRPSHVRRVYRKITGYPRAIYFHMLEGRVRIRKGLEPRLW